jgi:hypothetical protein
MNSMPIRVAVRYVGRWVAIIFFVVLLTLIFSFLGTIICAVLAGMMMGATKHPRWQAVAIAVVFPAVIFSLLRGSRAELLQGQILGLALLCFGAFWATYLVTSIVIWFERKQAAAPTPVTLTSGTTSQPPRDVAAERISNPEPLSIEALQGEWVCQAAALNGQPHRKRIAIQQNKITLSVIDPDGQARVVAEGKMKVD